MTEVPDTFSSKIYSDVKVVIDAVLPQNCQMPRREQVIIFARAPRLFTGKRRLARDIGNLRAYYFYLSNLKRLISALQNGPWQLHIAVAADADKHHRLFRNESVIVQPDGDLGHRMTTVLAQFSGNARVIIGSDIPLLESCHIEEAFDALSDHELVIGPALDGGFWCIGSNPLHIPSSQFMSGVRWSSPHALSDTLATVDGSVRVAKIATLADVDDAASFAQYRKAINKS